MFIWGGGGGCLGKSIAPSLAHSQPQKMCAVGVVPSRKADTIWPNVGACNTQSAMVISKAATGTYDTQ